MKKDNEKDNGKAESKKHEASESKGVEKYEDTHGGRVPKKGRKQLQNLEKDAEMTGMAGIRARQAKLIHH